MTTRKHCVSALQMTLTALATALLLAACRGNNLSGIYADKNGQTRFEFQSNGKMLMSFSGLAGASAATELTYVVEDGKVKLSGDGGKEGNLVLTIDNKGCIEYVTSTLRKQ